MLAQLVHLCDPAFNLGAILGRDVLLLDQVLAQIGQGRIWTAQVIVTGSEVAHEDRHARVVDAQLQEGRRGFFVVSLFVELGRLFRIGGTLLVEASRCCSRCGPHEREEHREHDEDSGRSLVQFGHHASSPHSGRWYAARGNLHEFLCGLSTCRGAREVCIACVKRRHSVERCEPGTHVTIHVQVRSRVMLRTRDDVWSENHRKFGTGADGRALARGCV